MDDSLDVKSPDNILSISIWIEMPSGDRKYYSFTPDTTIQSIKHKINMDLQVPIKLHGTILMNNKSLHDYNIKDNMVLSAGLVTVAIKHPNERPKLLTISLLSNLQTLKDQISEIFRINNDCFTIHIQENAGSGFNTACHREAKYGKELSNLSCTLLEYGIIDHQCLYLMIISTGNWLKPTTTVTVRTLMGKDIILEDVRPAESVLDIATRIQFIEGVPPDAQRLICGGKQLDFSKTLMEEGIEENPIIHLVLRLHHWERKSVWKNKTTTLLVKTLTGRVITLQNVKSTETILDVKIRIQKKIKIYHTKQRLIFAGKQLQDEKILTDEGVEENSTLHLVLRLRQSSEEYLHVVNDILCEQVINLVDERSNDKEYKQLVKKWDASCMYRADSFLKIEHVFKIEKNYEQNMMIYNAVLSTQKNKGKEDLLFHGTNYGNITKIINTGFNRDYNITSLYGKGTYFSNSARIAAEYSSDQNKGEHVYAMIACRVYIGDSTVGRRDMKRSELYKADKVTQYDSLVNDLNDPSIFVINRDYHAVPCFVIVFTLRDIQ